MFRYKTPSSFVWNWIAKRWYNAAIQYLNPNKFYSNDEKHFLCSIMLQRNIIISFKIIFFLIFWSFEYISILVWNIFLSQSNNHFSFYYSIKEHIKKLKNYHMLSISAKKSILSFFFIFYKIRLHSNTKSMM